MISGKGVCFINGPIPNDLPSESFDPYQTANKRMLLALREVIVDHIDNKGIDTFITGMNLGIDLWSSRIILKLKKDEKYKHIKLVGAIPDIDISKEWNSDRKEEWDNVYDNLDLIYEVYLLEDYKLVSRLELVEEEFINSDGEIDIIEVEKRVYPSLSEKIQKCNEFMVNNSDRGIIVFTGNDDLSMECALYGAENGLGSDIVLLSPTSLSVQEGIV